MGFNEGSLQVIDIEVVFFGSLQIIDIEVVFFTLTDRASTIPSNIRGCQSGTWSAGREKIRGI